MSLLDPIGAAWEAYLEDLWEEKCRKEEEEMQRELESQHQDILVALDVLEDNTADDDVLVWASAVVESVIPRAYSRPLPWSRSRSRSMSWSGSTSR